MQLQIEYNHAPLQKQLCVICNELFQRTDAQVIACDEQGKPYGEVCPHCLKEGFHWLSDRFDQLTQPKKANPIRHAQPRKVPMGVWN